MSCVAFFSQMPQKGWPGWANFRFVIAHLFIIFVKPDSTNAYICDPLPENTWERLVEVLDNSSDGFVMLCPFEITGENCPPPADDDAPLYIIPIWTSMYVTCENPYGIGPTLIDEEAGVVGGGGETGCLIDCPGTHFEVGEHASLSLDSITLRGSTSSAVKVNANGVLNVFNSFFEENWEKGGNGGAIYAVEGSQLYLSQSSFSSNRAPNGGAVYSLGHAQVHYSFFVWNRATARGVDEGGGAIYAGPTSKISIADSYFANNAAVSFGPSVLDLSNGNFSATTNTACNNTAESIGFKCDGSLSVLGGVEVCTPFEHICASSPISTAPSTNTGPYTMQRSGPFSGTPTSDFNAPTFTTPPSYVSTALPTSHQSYFANKPPHGTVVDYESLATPFVPIHVIDEQLRPPLVPDHCPPLREGDPLSTSGSYLQGTISSAEFHNISGLGSCGSLVDIGSHGAWYSVVGSAGVMTAHTCSVFFESFNFDTQIAIYTTRDRGDAYCKSGLRCINANDDFCAQQSLVSWLAAEGIIYYIYVTIRRTQASIGLAHRFSLTLAPTPGGSCKAAIAMDPHPATGEFELLDDPSGMNLLSVTGAVWYKVSGTGNWLMASTCQENRIHPSRINIFKGDCGNDQNHLVDAIIERSCLSGQFVTWLSEPGEQYFIQEYRTDFSVYDNN